MDHIAYLKKLVIRFTPDRMDKLKNFSLLLAYIINILMIISYDIQVKNLFTDITNYAYNYNSTLDNSSNFFNKDILILKFVNLNVNLMIFIKK